VCEQEEEKEGGVANICLGGEKGRMLIALLRKYKEEVKGQSQE